MYNKVIVAVDLSESAERVVKRAAELVGNDLGKLQLAHVVEPIPTVWGMESYAINPLDLQEKILESSAGLLSELADKCSIPKAQQHTLLGEPAAKIRELQNDIGADAIVIGSHGHSGWKIMLGSTAIKLLHGATVDVLTVYVPD